MTTNMVTIVESSTEIFVAPEHWDYGLEDFCPVTFYLPFSVVPRPCCESGVVRTIDDIIAVFYAEHTNITNREDIQSLLSTTEAEAFPQHPLEAGRAIFDYDLQNSTVSLRYPLSAMDRVDKLLMERLKSMFEWISISGGINRGDIVVWEFHHSLAEFLFMRFKYDKKYDTLALKKYILMSKRSDRGLIRTI